LDDHRSRRITTFGFVLAFAVGAAVVGLVLAAWAAPSFEATVGWRFEPTLVEGDADRDAFLAAIAQEDVLRAALRSLGSGEPTAAEVAELRDRLQARLDPAGTDGVELWLALRARAPWTATREAAAVADALEALDRSAAGAQGQRALAELDASIDALAEEVRAQQVLGGGDDGRVTELVAARGRLIETRTELAAAIAAGEPPLALERAGPVRWAPAPTVIVAAAAAALIGGLVGFVAQRSSTRAGRPARRRGRPEVGARRGGTPLAVFPRPRMDRDPASFEAADRLRVRVLALTAQARPRVVMVSGALQPAGAVDVASLLAEELAYNGARTLLVDGVIYAPALASRYGVPEPTDAGDAGPRAATTLEWLQHPAGSHHLVTIDVSDGRSLDLVPQFRPARPAPGTAPALFAGFGEALERWAAYDAIVVHAPPLEAVEDGRLLARFATGVLLVTDVGGLDRRAEQRLTRIIRDAGSGLLGTVEVEAEASRGDDEPAEVPERRAGRAVGHGSTPGARGTRGAAPGRTGS
jgi:Mrp family chromosome partitioning ATPase